MISKWVVFFFFFFKFRQLTFIINCCRGVPQVAGYHEARVSRVTGHQEVRTPRVAWHDEVREARVAGHHKPRGTTRRGHRNTWAPRVTGLQAGAESACWVNPGLIALPQLGWQKANSKLNEPALGRPDIKEIINLHKPYKRNILHLAYNYIK